MRAFRPERCADCYRIKFFAAGHCASLAGDTLHTLYRTATMDEIENSVRQWLRKRIAEMKGSAGSRVILSKENAA